MFYAVEMFLDGNTSKEIENYWFRFKELGISDYLITVGSRPHISIGVYRDMDIDPVLGTLSGICKEFRRIPVRFSSVGIFTSPKPCIFLSPVVTEQLTKTHNSVWTLLGGQDCSGYDFYKKDQWVPHCAVGMSGDRETIKKCTALLTDDYTPINGYIDSIGLVELGKPVKLIDEYELMENKESEGD